jgi:hypothetical protein
LIFQKTMQQGELMILLCGFFSFNYFV